MSGRALRVVLIGYGPVGSRLVEDLLPRVADGTLALTVVGAENEDAYNRVLVAEYAVGATGRDRLDLTDTRAAREAGVDVRLGDVAVAIDRVRQRVILDDGSDLAYDRLVFATGSRANVPTLGGLTPARRDRQALPGAELDQGARPLPRGVVALRDLRDAEAVLPVVAGGGTIVVLGAGVLGMEFALLASEQGARVIVVHHGSIPMARNLDESGGRMLARAARSLGVGMAGHARAESVGLRDEEGGPVFDGLSCADGTYLQGDLLVLSCGVAPRVELALAADLACSAGVLVDEHLRSWSDPDVFAIGDCAQIATPEEADPSGRVPGAPSGLIGPGWHQAAALARRLGAEALGALAPSDAAIERDERPTAVMLKSTGVDVVSGGEHGADAWDADAEVSSWIDPSRGAYLKTVVRDGVLTGFVSVGLPRAGAELTLLFERRGSLSVEPSALLRLDASDAESMPAANPLGPEATVCWCNGVTVGRIEAAAAEGCDTVDAVGRATRAGTGCGGCKGRISALIASVSAVAG